MAQVAARRRAGEILYGWFGAVACGLAVAWPPLVAQTLPGPVWRQLPPIGAYLPVGAYSEPSGAVLVLGGESPGINVWRWSGSWSEIRTTSAPPRRARPALAHDTGRGVLVLFGGLSDSLAVLGDTWEFDGLQWTRRLVPIAPPPRHRAGMAYDPSRQRCVLFGGSPSVAGAALADTWEYDGSAWTPMAPATLPPPMAGCECVHVPSLQRVLLLGDGGGLQLSTWGYDGIDWTVVPAQSAPPARTDMVVAHDPLRDRVVMFGGIDAQGSAFSTWEFDGSAWAQAPTATTPLGRFSRGITWSPAFAATVVFGGYPGGIPRPSAAFYAFQGTDWLPVTPEALFTRRQPALAFDSARDRLVLHGGRDEFGQLRDETFEWANGSWQQTAVGPGPFERMAYDPDRQCIVALLAGMTFEYRGSGWVPRSLAPTPAPGPMWFDRHLRRVRVANPGVVWSFDGSTWSSVPAADGSLVGAAVAAVHSSALDRAVAHAAGGALMAFDGIGWSPGPGPLLAATSAVEDVTRGRLIVITSDGRVASLDHGAGTIRDGLPHEALFDLTTTEDLVGGRVFAVGAFGAVWTLEWPGYASLGRYGRGCAASGGVPVLRAINTLTTPRLGLPLPLALDNLPAAAGLGVLFYGDSIVQAGAQALPISLAALGLPGCSAWLPLLASSPFVHAGSTATLTVALPANPSLAGVLLGLQAFVLDPAAGNGFGAVSNAVLVHAW